MKSSHSRALFLYTLLSLLFTTSLYQVHRVWYKRGKEELRMQATLDQGKKLPWHYYVSVYGPRALKVNVALSCLLLLAGPWAVRRRFVPAEQTKSKDTRFVVAGTAFVILVAAVWTAPRLRQSLWTDEATAMLRYIVGGYVQDAEGKWALEKVPPERRQFYMLTPNNHMLYSTLAGVTHEWLAPEMKKPTDYYFSEVALRLPAYLGGMLALVSLAWLCMELGLGKVSCLCAALLALHPWHAQYLALARGYSLVMACIPAFLAASLRALRTGHWRWWWATLLPQVIMVDTWPLAADVVIVGNCCILALLYWERRSKIDRQIQCARWAVVSLLAAMTMYQLLAPALPQIALYMKNNARYGADTVSFVVNPFLALFSAQGWTNVAQDNPYSFGWVTSLLRYPWSVLQLSTCVALFGRGILSLLRGSLRERCLAAFILGVPALITLHLFLSSFVYLPWYGVPALPGCIIAIGYGAKELLSRLPTAKGQTIAAVIFLSVCLVSWAPQHLALKAVPGGQNRESAQITRRILNPLHPDYGKESYTAFIGALYEGYDNLAVQIHNLADLEKCTQQSKAEGKPLFVNLGRENILEPAQVEVRQHLEKSGDYLIHGPLYGWEPEATRWVYEWKPKKVR